MRRHAMMDGILPQIPNRLFLSLDLIVFWSKPRILQAYFRKVASILKYFPAQKNILAMATCVLVPATCSIRVCLE